MAIPLSKYIRKVTDPVQDALNPIYGVANKVTEPVNQLAGAVGNPLNQATGSIAQSLAGSNLNPMSTAANVSPVQQTPNEYNFLGQTEVELDRNILDKIGGFIGGIKPTLTGQGSAYRSVTAGQREGAVNALNRERMTALAKDARSVNNLLKAGDIEGATNILSSRVSAIGKLGGDASDTQGILDMITSGDIGAAVADLDLTVNRAIEGEYISPLSREERDLAERIKAGVVSGVSKETPLENQMRLAGVKPGTPEARRMARIASGTATKEDLQFKILGVPQTRSNGLTTTQTTQGTIFTDVEGNELSKGERRKALEEATEFSIDQIGKEAVSRAEAGARALSIRVAGESFDKINAISKGLSTLNKAIRELDAGAQTGVIESLLPSVKASSIRLDNVRNELGLDVVSSVTFGALSEAELELALQTGLPTNLQPEELRQWVEDKIKYQTILRDGLEDAAIFLMEGGSIGDLVKTNRQKREQQAQGSSRFQIEVVN